MSDRLGNLAQFLGWSSILFSLFLPFSGVARGIEFFTLLLLVPFSLAANPESPLFDWMRTIYCILCLGGIAANLSVVFAREKHQLQLRHGLSWAAMVLSLFFFLIVEDRRFGFWLYIFGTLLVVIATQFRTVDT